MSTTGGYDPLFFEKLVQIEDQHFWFRARNQLISTLAQKTIGNSIAIPQILEVGCGTGNTLRALEKSFPQGSVTGMDLFIEGLRFAQQRTQNRLVQADLQSPPFKSCFDLIGLFDVLEHLEDDRAALVDLLGMLKPGGTLFLTVPADPNLWSYFDEASHHVRRYTPNDLSKKLVEAGFEIQLLTPFMTSLYIPMRLSRAWTKRVNQHNLQNAPLQSRTLSENELRIIPLLNSLIGIPLALERWWIVHNYHLPVGTSLLAIARRHEILR